MSKAYGLPGLRVGWMATQNTSILKRVQELKEYVTICNSGPSEFLAEVALRNREPILARNRSIIQKNLPLIDAFLDKYPQLFSWHRPVAGPIGFMKMNFSNDDKTFADKVVTTQNVLILPGNIYDYPGYFRVGFGRKAMPEALEQFEKYIINHLV